MNIGVDQSVIN